MPDKYKSVHVNGAVEPQIFHTHRVPNIGLCQISLKWSDPTAAAFLYHTGKMHWLAAALRHVIAYFSYMWRNYITFQAKVIRNRVEFENYGKLFAVHMYNSCRDTLKSLSFRQLISDVLRSPANWKKSTAAV